MTTTAILGYLALGLLLVSAWTPTMIWLRAFAVAAAVVVTIYGLVTANYWVVAIAVILATIHAWRLVEMRRLVSLTRAATAGGGAPLTLEWLLPYMQPIAIPKDTVLFHKDSAADAIYFIEHGKIRFEELGVDMEKGTLFGEIGIFSHDKKRTATAKVIEDSSLLRISDEKVRELYFQNPEFGFFIVGLITRRLIEDGAKGTLTP